MEFKKRNAMDSTAFYLRHPAWTAFLGRKSCVPTYPLIPIDTEESASVKDSLDRFPLAERVEQEARNVGPKPKTFRAEIESAEGVYLRNDSLRYADRRFSARRVEYYTVRRNEDVPRQIDALYKIGRVEIQL